MIAVQPAKPLVFAVGCCRLLPQQAPISTAERLGLFLGSLSLLSLSVQLSAYCLQVGTRIASLVVELIHVGLCLTRAHTDMLQPGQGPLDTFTRVYSIVIIADRCRAHAALGLQTIWRQSSC